jgi:hypothetical protein
MVSAITRARYAATPSPMTTRTPKAGPKASATYVYCVVRSDAAVTLGKGAKGLPGAGAPRVLPAADDFQLVVSTVPLATYSAEVIESKLQDLDWVGAVAAAHEAVVERAGALGTVVPMKLFTIFQSDERAVHHVAKMKKDLSRVVARIAGCDEWGLRILFDEAAAVKKKERAQAKAAAKAPVSGTGFLLRKKAQEETRRVLTTEAKEEVDDLFARLERTSKKAVRRPPPNRELAGRVLLDAVFLVPKKVAPAFKGEVAGSAKELAREGYHVTLTGPWPAYSFIEGR